MLVIEVADSSTEFDRTVKLPLYAEAGISEVWIVNLPDEKVEMFASAVNGVYQKRAELKRGEHLKSEMVPGLSLSVDSIFG